MIILDAGKMLLKTSYYVRTSLKMLLFKILDKGGKNELLRAYVTENVAINSKKGENYY